MRIALISNTAWSLVNFRKGLINRLVAEGHQVFAIAPNDEYSNQLQALGVVYVDINVDNKGTNPLRDVALFLNLSRLLTQKKIDLALLYTIKPVIYGSLACGLLGIPAIAVITGLGTAFLRDGLLTRVVELLYRISLRKVHSVFFLNDDDMNLFIKKNLARNEVFSKIPGEGVNLIHFTPIPNPVSADGRSTRFLFAGRMLRDKGLIEFVEAARIVKQRYLTAQFILVGFVSVANDSAINIDQINAWVDEGIVIYLGPTSDVRDHIANSDCFVLPSYREGISRALLEAMAMARPVIATDVVGCRELVNENINGLLCNPRDVESLANTFLKFIEMDNNLRVEMGRQGRLKVEREYSESVVIGAYLEQISKLAHLHQRID
jgi:glycosyltransferase involved in cell wall biosynthesis